MSRLYNQIANHSLERLAALSDGVFAFAMTVLVLDIHLPSPAAIHSEYQLVHSLLELLPQIVMCLMSLLTLGVFWSVQQTQLNNLAGSDRAFQWIHIGFLFGVILMPFSTKLLTAFIDYRAALIAYWLNMFLIGCMLYWSWEYVARAKLVKEGISLEVRSAIRDRVVIAQAFYAAGAVLCVISTRWSIGFILAAQLYFAIAPSKLIRQSASRREEISESSAVER